MSHRWVIWAIYVAVWTFVLLTPYPIHLSRGILPAGTGFPLFKTGHVVGYAVFAILSGWLPTRRGWSLLVFLSVHGLLTEYLQNFVADRTGTWLDVGLDHLGIVLGLALSWKWWRDRLTTPIDPG